MATPTTAHGTAAPQYADDEPNYDKSQLYLHEGMKFGRIHRDYLAHAIRFEFIVQKIKPVKETAVILDVGCGDIPLMRALDSGMNRPKFYVGVDVRKQTIESRRAYFKNSKTTFPFELICMDFTEADQDLLDIQWTHIICFEVLEHMPKGRGLMLLDKLREAASPIGTIYLSTPTFDGAHKPSRHKYEWTYDELKEELGNRYEITNHWGTFSNLRDLQKVLTPAEREVWDSMNTYWGNVGKSLIFSPLHPEAARNVMWELKPKP